MTLDEAIKHAEEVAEKNERRAESVRNRPISSADFYNEEEFCSKCAEEHRQFAEWLKELKRHREAWQKVIDEINKEKEDAMFKPDSDFYDGVFYALGFTLGVIDKELGEVGDTD